MEEVHSDDDLVERIKLGDEKAAEELLDEVGLSDVAGERGGCKFKA